MRKLILLFLALIVGLSIALAITYWPKISRKIATWQIKKNPEEDQKKVAQLLAEKNPQEALKTIILYKTEIESRAPEGKIWTEYLLEASEQIPEPRQLVYLYEFSPDLFKDHEKASLLVADQYIKSRQKTKYQEVRDQWKNRDTMKEAWFVLDADKLLLEGNKREAVQFLQSQTFEGPKDTGRLVRLGLLNLMQDPKASWDYFAEAMKKDPANPDIRIYRAKLLEAAGKTPFAVLEYKAASDIDPKSVYIKDQAAEFYMRNYLYPQAYELWIESLPAPSVDVIWLKTLFWNKVLIPFKFEWSKHTPPKGNLEPLVRYFLELPNDRFWDESKFAKIPDGQNFLRTEQSTYWLRLLQTLKDGKDNDALQLIEYNPFQEQSLYPELELALLRVLKYRQNGTMDIGSLEQPLKAEIKKRITPQRIEPNFFKQIEEIATNLKGNAQQPNGAKGYAVPADIEAVLKSPSAFAALFLAGGWMEAGLQLNTYDVVPDDFPDWYAYAVSQSLRYNRSNMEALEFLTKQKVTPLLELLEGELLIADNSPDAAIEQLLKLSTNDDEYGFRAAWLASLVYIDKKEYDKAAEVVKNQPRLLNDILGQEVLGRIALLKGDDEEATLIYSKIEANSAEARSYLARKAFLDKDWNRAQQLTEALVQEFPNNPILIDNLRQIKEELDKQKGGSLKTETSLQAQ